MNEIKGIAFENGHLLILNSTDKFFICPKRPGVRFDQSGRKMPQYDEKTNQFVCGSDEAEAALRELLANTLVCQEQGIPPFIMDDPLLSEEVAGAEKDWRKFSVPLGIKPDNISMVPA